jgi:hypothetical protein|eukprot:evm.model.NODE_26981_length_61533_cov_35.017178.19
MVEKADEGAHVAMPMAMHGLPDDEFTSAAAEIAPAAPDGGAARPFSMRIMGPGLSEGEGRVDGDVE